MRSQCYIGVNAPFPTLLHPGYCPAQKNACGKLPYFTCLLKGRTNLTHLVKRPEAIISLFPKILYIKNYITIFIKQLLHYFIKSSSAIVFVNGVHFKAETISYRDHLSYPFPCPFCTSIVCYRITSFFAKQMDAIYSTGNDKYTDGMNISCTYKSGNKACV